MSSTVVSAPERAAVSGPAGARRVGRRAFVRVAAVGAAALGGAALIGARLFSGQLGWWRRRVDNYAAAYSYAWLPPEERIRRHFDYLTIEPGAAERFVREFEREHGRVTPRAVEANRLLYTEFLMSTDFFRNGGDESKPVRFVAYHDPYRSPCWVPFPNA